MGFRTDDNDLRGNTDNEPYCDDCGILTSRLTHYKHYGYLCGSCLRERKEEEEEARQEEEERDRQRAEAYRTAPFKTSRYK